MSNCKRKLFYSLSCILFSVCCLPIPSFASDDDPVLRFVFTIEKFYKDPLNTPIGIFVDKERKEIYVADSGRNEVLIFDLKGHPVFKFGKAQGISNPFDMVVKDGRIYLVQEGKPYIEIFNYRGESIARLAPPEDMPFAPGRITIDEDNNIYVINKNKTTCLVFDKNDTFIGSIGKGLPSLTGVAVSKDRVYLITPFGGRIVRVYDKKGNFIMAFEGIEGEGGTLGLPTNAMIDRGGLLWLVDSLRGISVYKEDGIKLFQLGEYGAEKWQLFFPMDIDFDKGNMVYIANKGSKSIGVFAIENQGRLYGK